MNVSEIQLYNILKEKMGEPEAQTLVEFVDSKSASYFENKKETLVSKGELHQTEANLKEDIANTRSELKEEITNVRLELKEDINKVELKLSKVETSLKEDINKVELKLSKVEIGLKGDINNLGKELRQEISKLSVDTMSFKAEIIKWMFIFWVGQTATIIAIIKFVL